jgi:hypothetical protein
MWCKLGEGVPSKIRADDGEANANESIVGPACANMTLTECGTPIRSRHGPPRPWTVAASSRPQDLPCRCFRLALEPLSESGLRAKKGKVDSALCVVAPAHGNQEFRIGRGGGER